MRIGLTYDLQTDSTDPRQAEFDPPGTIAAVDAALQALGHEVVRLGGAADLLRAPQRLHDVGFVFNLAEGAHGRCREAWVPMLLERWGVPFVGSGSTTQALALDKVMSKRLAHASGLLTPSWCVLEQANAAPRAAELGFPLIVKPRWEGSGAGIDPGAVVQDLASLRRRAAWVIERYDQPCLVEQFIPHGELTVFLIGNNPPQALPAIQRPLEPVSRLSCHVAGSSTARTWLCPIDLTADVDAAAGRIAAAAFEALRCRDVARVDLRVDAQGRIYFLEINPLPSFDPDGSLGLLAEYLGLTYTHLVGQILNTALLRVGLPTSWAATASR